MAASNLDYCWSFIIAAMEPRCSACGRGETAAICAKSPKRSADVGARNPMSLRTKYCRGDHSLEAGLHLFIVDVRWTGGWMRTLEEVSDSVLRERIMKAVRRQPET